MDSWKRARTLDALQLLLQAAPSHFLSSTHNEHWHLFLIVCMFLLARSLDDLCFQCGIDFTKQLWNLSIIVFVPKIKKMTVTSSDNCSHKCWMFFDWDSFNHKAASGIWWHTKKKSLFDICQKSLIMSHSIVATEVSSHFQKITESFWQGQSVKMPLTPPNSCWAEAGQRSASEYTALTSSSGTGTLAPLQSHEMCLRREEGSFF